MGSGDSIAGFEPFENVPPSTNYALPDLIDAVTGVRPVLDFSTSADKVAIFNGRIPRHYDGGGLTLKIEGAIDTANTGTKVVRISASFERVTTSDDLDAGGSDFASAQTSEITVNNTANAMFSGTIAFTDGAQMDSLAAGDKFRLRITRHNSGLTGTNATGDFQLLGLELVET